MDQHYNWSDPSFQARAFQSINLAVNYVAETVHAVWSTVTIVTTQSQVTTTTEQQTTSTTVIVTTSSPPIGGHVVINEVEQDPPGEDRDHEWVEFFNPTASTIDVGNWIIFTTHGDIESYVIPTGTVITAAGFWPVPLPGLFIDNEQDSLVLLNTLGKRVDETPNLTDQDNNASSWQRVPDGSDSWVYAPSTQGVINVPEYPSPALLALGMLTMGLLILRRSRGRSRASRTCLSSYPP
jgi:hypothetical protein